MAKAIRKGKDIVDLMTDWQGVEACTVEFANKEMRKADNPLIKTMLQVIGLEAEKHRLLQQMIVDSEKKEAVSLSPDELAVLSGHLNRYLEAEGKEMCCAEEAGMGNKPYITRYLISYLLEDLRSQSCIMRHFEDELKNASIPTSATSKKFGTARAA
jgi:hypothetical protein